jgi:hypothetical protein
VIDIFFRRAPRAGTTVINTDGRTPDEAGASLWLRDGATVRARTEGEVTVRNAADSVVIHARVAVLPQGSSRDTLHLSATCSMPGVRPG